MLGVNLPSPFLPILIFNEFFARETSRKIRAVFKAMGQSGKSLSTNPPCGYVKDSADKTHWIVDEQATEMVRDVFRRGSDHSGQFSPIALLLF